MKMLMFCVLVILSFGTAQASDCVTKQEVLDVIDDIKDFLLQIA